MRPTSLVRYLQRQDAPLIEGLHSRLFDGVVGSDVGGELQIAFGPVVWAVEPVPNTDINTDLLVVGQGNQWLCARGCTSQ
jgi:hypothetical protein